MIQPSIVLERRGAVATLWLNRHEVHNAFDEHLIADITARLRELGRRHRPSGTCDIAVATPQASFGTTEARLGLVLATISPYVIRAIGARAAQRHFLTAERFHGDKAHALGLVQELCDADKPDVRVGEMTSALLASAPTALSACKNLIHAVTDRPMSPELIADTSQRIASARGSAEAREGISAFFDKRKPAWGT